MFFAVDYIISENKFVYYADVLYKEGMYGDDYDENGEIIVLGIHGITGTPTITNNIIGNELLPEPPDNWTTRAIFNYLEITINKGCRLSINNSNPIYFRQGRHVLSHGKIWSVKIIDVDVSFSWIGKLAKRK